MSTAATPPPHPPSRTTPLHTVCTRCRKPILAYHCTSLNCPWCRKCKALAAGTSGQ